MNPYTPESQWRIGLPPCWTCTDFVTHAHRWWLTAWLCSLRQRWLGWER